MVHDVERDCRHKEAVERLDLCVSAKHPILWKGQSEKKDVDVERNRGEHQCEQVEPRCAPRVNDDECDALEQHGGVDGGCKESVCTNALFAKENQQRVVFVLDSGKRGQESAVLLCVETQTVLLPVRFTEETLLGRKEKKREGKRKGKNSERRKQGEEIGQNKVEPSIKISANQAARPAAAEPAAYLHRHQPNRSIQPLQPKTMP